MNKRRVFLIPVIALLLAFCAVQIGCKSKKSDDSFTDERDGNTYKIVKIGEQIWMAENLKYLPSVDAPTTGSYTEPHYYVYDYEGNNVEEAKQPTHTKHTEFYIIGKQHYLLAQKVGIYQLIANGNN